MIDPRIIKLLDSADVETRKKAVMALAKTKDRAALPHLAKVYKNDKSAEVRELARKGGVYIKKQLEEAAAPVVHETYAEPDDYASGGYDYEDEEEDDQDSYSSRLRYYDEEEEEEEDESPLPIPHDHEEVVLPSDVYVSPGEEQRARGYVDQAMDWNVRGNNEKAAQLLQRALKINPRLMYDSYTLSIAATVTGMSGQEAVRVLGPRKEDLKKKVARSKGVGGAASGVQILMALLVVLGAAVALVGYFIMPWIDLSSIPIQDETTGQITTFGESIDQAKDQFNALIALAGSDANTPEVREIRSAIDGLTVSINGLDTTLVSIGSQNLLEAMGIIDLLNVFMGMLGGGFGIDQGQIDAAMDEFDAAIPEPAPLDYSLILVPVMAVAAVLFGIVLVRGGSVASWLLAIIIGLLGVGPMIYFYLSGMETVIPSGEEVGLGGFGELNIPTGTDLLGVGYWISLAGMLAVIILPFIALLLMPTPEKSTS